MARGKSIVLIGAGRMGGALAAGWLAGRSKPNLAIIAPRPAPQVQAWAEEGLVNILGGCCGTTPEHIAAIAQAAEGLPPRKPASTTPAMRLAGLEPFEVA